MPEFYIKGLKEIQRAFEELPKNVARKVIRQNLRKSMKPMQSRVDADAPVGETGSLKEAKLLAGKKKRGVISMNVALVLDSTSTHLANRNGRHHGWH